MRALARSALAARPEQLSMTSPPSTAHKLSAHDTRSPGGCPALASRPTSSLGALPRPRRYEAKPGVALRFGDSLGGLLFARTVLVIGLSSLLIGCGATTDPSSSSSPAIQLGPRKIPPEIPRLLRNTPGYKAGIWDLAVWARQVNGTDYFVVPTSTHQRCLLIVAPPNDPDGGVGGTCTSRLTKRTSYPPAVMATVPVGIGKSTLAGLVPPGVIRATSQGVEDVVTQGVFVLVLPSAPVSYTLTSADGGVKNYKAPRGPKP